VKRSARRTETDILSGLGNGILKDLESSIMQKERSIPENS
jgi:hypothetical protein